MANDNWKTLRVPVQAYEQAKEQKEEAGRTWGEQLCHSETTTTRVVDFSNVVEQLKEDINMNDESSGDTKRIMNRLDDLETEIRTLREALR